jgi:hypothetical protein
VAYTSDTRRRSYRSICEVQSDLIMSARLSFACTMWRSLSWRLATVYEKLCSTPHMNIIA